MNIAFSCWRVGWLLTLPEKPKQQAGKPFARLACCLFSAAALIAAIPF
jgi:hypothetical protein